MHHRAAAGRRRGIATLELVLVFPMLLAVVSILFVIGQAGVSKVGMATAARKQTWDQRPGAAPGPRLHWPHDPMAAPIRSAPSRDVSLGPVFGGQTQPALSRNTLVANPWAHEGVPFDPLDQNVIPHTTVLSYLPALLLGDVVGGLCQALENSYPNGALFVPFAVAGQAGNVAVIGAGVVLCASIFSTYPGVSLEAAALGYEGW